MVDKSKLAIATCQTQNPIPFKIELSFNLLSQMITIVVSILIETKIEYYKIMYSTINISPDNIIRNYCAK